MAAQQFRIVDENGSPKQATVEVVCWGVSIFSVTAPISGIVSATVQPFANNLIYVRYQSYTPVEYAYLGSGGESIIEIRIKTCISLTSPIQDYGSFLRWSPVSYPARLQTQPLSICEVSDQTSKSPVCDRYIPEYELETYSLPAKKGDVLRWIMQESEIDFDDYSLLKIGITQNGIIKAEDCGTVTLEDGQVFCEATIPCLPECDYEFVIYRGDVPITLELDKTAPETELDCTGVVVLIATGGTPAYKYSIDNGETWQTSNTFSGLCAGAYTFLVEDSDYSQASITTSLFAFTCGQFEGDTLQEVIDSGVTLGEIINAGCTLCEFVVDKSYFVNGGAGFTTSNPSFIDSSGWGIMSGTPIFTNSSVILNNAAIEQGGNLVYGGVKIVVSVSNLVGSLSISADTLQGAEPTIITSNGIHEITINGDFYYISASTVSGTPSSCIIDYIYTYRKINC